MGIAFGVSGAFPIVYGPVEVCRINGANSLIILVFLHYSSARPCPTSSADCFLQPRAPSSLHFTFFKRRINSFIKTFYTSQIVIMKNIALTFAAAFIAGAAAEIHSVVVGGLEGGNPKLVFEPNFVNAVVGDVVRFEFHQKNHSVVQTSFGEVCHPLLDTSYKPVFETQFFPVANDDTTFPTFDYTVQDASKPLWFYCSQKAHCGKGMVFSINCPSGDAPNSLDNFVKSALEFGAQEAAASSWAATATSDVYGTKTYAPVYHPTVTDIVTLGDKVWTTTYESYYNSPNPTPASVEGTVHEVIVGGDNGLTYNPPSIAANVRDTIVFKFVSKNHTATQSSFGNPCLPLSQTSLTGQSGFDSGFLPGSADNSPTYSITVNDTAPIWVYCQQKGHCGNGMVFAVNADESSDRNFAAFQQLAKTLNGTSASNPTSGSYGAAAASISSIGAAATVGLMVLGSMMTFIL